MTAPDTSPIRDTDCEHHFECVNYGMVRNEKDPLHIYVTEVCTDCLQTRALTFRRLVMGEWMSVPEFQTMHKDNIIGAKKEEVDDDHTLGACGCIDYHYADCPTRQGGTGYGDEFDYEEESWRD